MTRIEPGLLPPHTALRDALALTTAAGSLPLDPSCRALLESYLSPEGDLGSGPDLVDLLVALALTGRLLCSITQAESSELSHIWTIDQQLREAASRTALSEHELGMSLPAPSQVAPPPLPAWGHSRGDLDAELAALISDLLPPVLATSPSSGPLLLSETGGGVGVLLSRLGELEPVRAAAWDLVRVGALSPARNASALADAVRTCVAEAYRPEAPARAPLMVVFMSAWLLHEIATIVGARIELSGEQVLAAAGLRLARIC